MLLLVDLDGVVYRGARPVPGVAAVLADRARRGDDVVYVTNNSMYYRTEYVDRLAALGAPVTGDRVVSSARATALYLAEHEPRIRRVLAVGGEGLRRELGDVGLGVVDARELAERLAGEDRSGGDGPAFAWTLTSADDAPDRTGGGGRGNAPGEASDEHRIAVATTDRGRPAPGDVFEAAGHPGAVVVGLDPKFTYRTLALAADAIRAGSRFIATNRDPTFPTEHGLRPGAGSIVAALEATTGITPISIGKPAPYLLREAAGVVGGRAEDAIMIGDGLVTDIAAAHGIGARSILMMTGVTTREQLDALPVSQRPTDVAENAEGLAAALERLGEG